MFCGHCGQLNPDTNTHCDSCGNEIRLALKTVPTTAAAPGQPSPLPKVENYSDSQIHDLRTGGVRVLFFNQYELRAGWRLLLYCFLAIIVVSVIALLTRGQGGPLTTLSPSFVFVSHGSLLLTVLIPAMVMAFFEKRSLAHYGLPTGLRRVFGKDFWLGMAWGVVALTVLLLVLRLSGAFLFGAIAVSAGTAIRFAVLWAIAFFLVGVAEEFMFRGYVQYTLASGMRALGDKPAFWVTAAITSLLFGVAHITNPGEKLLGLGTVVAIGLFFAFTLWRTGSLWFAIGFHASWDWAQTYLYGVPNSGIPARGHLLNPTIQGPHWLSGGSVGPEGSVLMYPLIVLLLLVFDRTFPKGTRYPSLAPPEKLAQDVVLG